MSDEVRGLLALLDSEITGPVNIGNSVETTILELAKLIIDITGSTSTLAHLPLPQDDPTQRKPDITLAREVLGWSPTVAFAEGLDHTVRWLRPRI